VIITPSELSQIPNGTAMFYNANFRNGKLVSSDGNSIYLVENGLKRIIPDGPTFLSYGFRWADIVIITPSELSQIPNGTALPKKT
jgi:hypothetical protein